MNENVDRFPKLKAFLWTLSSRNINEKNIYERYKYRRNEKNANGTI